MELQHFSHDHPLILNDQANDGDSGMVCYGCLRPVSGDTYECRQCDYVLHKSCVELPKQIIHFFHPQHPLTLLSKQPYGENMAASCSYCERIIWGFIYYCSICDYALDMKCVQMGQIVNHEGHEHSFMVFRPMSFTCDVCEETSEGMGSYICSTCQLLVHKRCASSLPITDSFHTLNLKSTFPTVVEDLQESRDTASQEEQVVSLITSDVNKQSSLEQNDMLSKIQHFSHPCQLILTNDEPKNEEICDELQNEEICDEPQNAKICNVCVRPISTPFYKCASCRFFLHPSCAQLPTTIRSILHPHRLTLLVISSAYTGNLFRCSTCRKVCTGFAYECKLCNFRIDAICASISKTTLKHDGHEHILSLDQKISKAKCSSCGDVCKTKFSCEDCDFNLDLRCALLPLTARHRWDEKHPLKLTFVNVEHISQFYFCDLCEEVRNTDHWYYCCKECDLSAHTTCLFGKHDIKYGAIYFCRSLHFHNLKLLAENSWHKCLCKSEGSTDNTDVVLECPTCDHTHVKLEDLFRRKKVPIVVEDLQESRDAASQVEQAVNLITFDVNKISPEENDKLSTIQNCSHLCHLILINDEPQNAEICNGCVRPISAPFYQCANNCKFFLHPRCAQLPTTIRTILHPHPLILRVRSSLYTENVFKCSICDKLCTGFGYECKLCDYFEIDARCASISKNILKHDGHEHILSLVQKFSEAKCSSCGDICRIKFSCKDCEFNLDLRCALLPLTARLGWDEEKHPLKLTYVNVENTAKFYFCDLCEEVRNPDDWYYCCKECDRSAHTACLFGKHDVKFGCGTYTWKRFHDHSLKILGEKSKNKDGCKSECETDNKDVVLECPTCNYHSHVNLLDHLLEHFN